MTDVKWNEDALRDNPEIDEFFYVVRDGSEEDIEQCANNGSDIDVAYSTYDMSPIGLAARMGSFSKVKLLRRLGAKIYVDNTANISQAADYGHVDILDYLLGEAGEEKGDDFDLNGTMGVCMYYATLQNHIHVMDYLLGRGADPNYQSEARGLRPIDWAQSPKKNLDAFLKLYPLTIKRYRKRARKNMEYIGFEQAYNRARTPEAKEELDALKAKYDQFMEEFEGGKN